MSDQPEPWAHQLEAVEKCAPLKGSALLIDMGGGKTRSAFMLMQRWKARRILMFTPKRVMRVWKDQAPTWAPDMTVVLLREPTIKQRRATASEAMDTVSGPLMLVANYEMMTKPDWFVWARMQQWDVVACDEMHRIKSCSSVVSRKMHSLGKSAKRRLGMSGTVMHDTPLDIFGSYRFLDDRVFGLNFRSFRSRYAVMGGYMNYEVKDYQNQEELHEKMYSIGYRVSTDDVVDLPERVFSEQWVTMDNRSVYRDIEDDFVSVLSSGIRVTVDIALTKLLRLREVTAGFVKSDDKAIVDLNHHKCDLLFDLISDLPDGEPLVVFCEFKESMRRVAETCQTAGRRVGFLNGSQDDTDQWHSEKIDVLVTQIRAGKEGNDFTRARVGIYYDLPLSLGDFEQSWRRIHRPGQRRPVVLYPLLVEDTVDEVQWQALKDKKEVVQYVTDVLRTRGEAHV